MNLWGDYMCQYKVGDRVVVINKPSHTYDNNKYIEIGTTGTIIDDSPPSPNGDIYYAVEFDIHIPVCHSCSGKGSNGRCWIIHSDSISLIKPNPMDIKCLI